ncbi:MAG TPA: hypothetical protein DD435_04680 [Cyanobacteria bacterium UBA8530]|nr:hypothetical protein [Cyanobacteria bacterium UBA8530]
MTFRKAIGGVLFASLLVLSTLPADALTMKKSTRGTSVSGGGGGNTATALLLSSMMPGLGESYLSGWKNGWPIAECVVGSVCCFFRASSIIDAASGVSDDEMRIDFWTLPNQ